MTSLAEAGSLDVYQKIEASGARVHWHKDRYQLAFIEIDYSRFGICANDVRDYVGYATSYAASPAITDDFDLNAQRMAWLKTQEPDVFAAYDLNRLRINKIVPVVQGLQVLARDLEDYDIFLANDLKIIGDRLMTDFKAQYRPKLPLEFADLVAAEGIKVLRHLAAYSVKEV